jgi:predicted pyridoxine 5'-phosphate oxidase superfamily flavin-nucleotide-binding protein
MIKMTDKMAQLLREALDDGTPCLVGTASKDGMPQISPKGSVSVLDEETLGYWERSFRSAHSHIAENPNVVIFYRNAARADEIPYRGAAMRFHGVARVVEDGPERERVWEATVPFEQGRDPEKKGVGVIVRVDRIEELSGAAIMSRD